MDPADLKVFEVVARLGGMSRAAAELNTVQSNVTARIRQLEARLGMPLFIRTGRGIVLTAAGHRLLPYAQRLRRLMGDAKRAVLDDGRAEGPLCIGSLETSAAIRLAPALNHFVSSHPGVDLTLRTGTTQELLAMVLAGSVEGAFVCGPVVHRALDTGLAWREELVLLGAPGSDPWRLVSDPPERLRLVVLRAGCSYRAKLESLMASLGSPAPGLLEFGTLEAVFSGVGAGLGVTLLPRSLLGPVLRLGRLAVATLPGEQGWVETVFVRRRDAHQSTALHLFLDCVRNRVAPSVPDAA